jgi:uncharacterized membrane protein
MNKKAFMEELKRRLKHLPKDDREDALNYYAEYLEEMGVDEMEDVTQRIGSPKEVARELLCDCTQKRMDEQKEHGGVKNSAKLVWLIILGIWASPIAIPMAFVVLVLLFAVLVVLLSVLFAIGCTGLALLFSGVFVFLAVLWAVGLAQKLVCAGVALVLCAVGVLLIIAVVWLAERMVRGIAVIFRKIFLREGRAK